MAEVRRTAEVGNSRGPADRPARETTPAAWRDRQCPTTQDSRVEHGPADLAAGDRADSMARGPVRRAAVRKAVSPDTGSILPAGPGNHTTSIDRCSSIGPVAEQGQDSPACGRAPAARVSASPEVTSPAAACAPVLGDRGSVGRAEEFRAVTCDRAEAEQVSVGQATAAFVQAEAALESAGPAAAWPATAIVRAAEAPASVGRMAIGRTCGIGRARAARASVGLAIDRVRGRDQIATTS